MRRSTPAMTPVSCCVRPGGIQPANTRTTGAAEVRGDVAPLLQRASSRRPTLVGPKSLLDCDAADRQLESVQSFFKVAQYTRSVVGKCRSTSSTPSSSSSRRSSAAIRAGPCVRAGRRSDTTRSCSRASCSPTPRRICHRGRFHPEAPAKGLVRLHLPCGSTHASPHGEDASLPLSMTTTCGSPSGWCGTTRPSRSSGP